MDFLTDLPFWLLASLIFVLRILDVSLGTVRTITVVQGRVRLAMVLGFVEILIWTVAISQVVTHLQSQPGLAVAYAGGFACGNALGIALERKLAMGSTALRIISREGKRVAEAVGSQSRVLAEIDAAGPDGPVNLVYLTCPRRRLPDIIDRARDADPSLFYVVERFAETSRLAPIPEPTGWRAVLKKK